MFDSESMGEKLLDARNRKGVTRKEVYAETGVHYNTLLQLESGMNTPRADTMLMLSNYYDRTVQELFFANEDNQMINTEEKRRNNRERYWAKAEERRTKEREYYWANVEERRRKAREYQRKKAHEKLMRELEGSK